MLHDLADLLGIRLGKRTTKNSEILAEDKYHPAIHGAIASDYAVTGDLLVRHAEIGAAVLDKGIPLFETVLVQQQFDTLTGREFTAAVLDVDPALSTSKGGGLTFLFQLFNNLMHR